MLLRNILTTYNTDQHGLMSFCIFSCPFPAFGGAGVSIRGYPICRRQIIIDSGYVNVFTYQR